MLLLFSHVGFYYLWFLFIISRNANKYLSQVLFSIHMRSEQYRKFDGICVMSLYVNKYKKRTQDCHFEAHRLLLITTYLPTEENNIYTNNQDIKTKSCVLDIISK